MSIVSLTFPEFKLPDIIKVPPIPESHGTVTKIVEKFGGADALREAVRRLQTLLYEE